MNRKLLALLPIALCSCHAQNDKPLNGIFLLRNWNDVVIPISSVKIGSSEVPLTNWLTVTSSSSPRVITSILKSPCTSTAAIGQMWVSASACYINTPEVHVRTGETNSFLIVPTYSTTNDWPAISWNAAMIFVRSFEKSQAGSQLEGQDCYARCRVRLWIDTAYVESNATLLLSSLTNQCTLIMPKP